MPTYEYACTNCGHRFDVRQSFHDEPISDCPECGASVRRVLYPAGVIFKGSGWYATDNRKGSASHSSSTSPSSDTSSTSSTETKAAPDKSEAPAKDAKAKTAAADD
ncbi:MAG TPA: FmdB family zinc ribbon protein [Thermomicrobiales bacterium]|nr:FmdB family zinc ribbon protein [Thermomicrobiales bacterium]